MTFGNVATYSIIPPLAAVSESRNLTFDVSPSLTVTIATTSPHINKKTSRPYSKKREQLTYLRFGDGCNGGPPGGCNGGDGGGGRG